MQVSTVKNHCSCYRWTAYWPNEYPVKSKNPAWEKAVRYCAILYWSRDCWLDWGKVTCWGKLYLLVNFIEKQNTRDIYKGLSQHLLGRWGKCIPWRKFLFFGCKSVLYERLLIFCLFFKKTDITHLHFLQVFCIIQKFRYGILVLHEQV